MGKNETTIAAIERHRLATDPEYPFYRFGTAQAWRDHEPEMIEVGLDDVQNLMAFAAYLSNISACLLAHNDDGAIRIPIGLDDQIHDLFRAVGDVQKNAAYLEDHLT